MNKKITCFNAACVQVSANNKMIENVDISLSLIRTAILNGAEFIFLPENVSMMDWGKKNIELSAVKECAHPALSEYRSIAEECNVWLNCGSLTILLEDSSIVNRSYLINPDGKIASYYDKIHMFDVDLGNGQRYLESSTYAPGNNLVVAPTPWGAIGLTICYDMRFPHLYRDMAKKGVNMISIPSAFTSITGIAHWHTLLRARAIETGSFIFAAAQTGEHPGSRQTYGHSLIVDPWGVVLADAGDEVGVIYSQININEVAIARKKIPSLTHDREYNI